jgi:hypothetical protein
MSAHLRQVFSDCKEQSKDARTAHIRHSNTSSNNDSTVLHPAALILQKKILLANVHFLNV